jgi:NADH:ubiquinone oxidoreductase subunit E
MKILLEELEKIQKDCNYLKKSELLKLSKKLGIPLSEIYGTASFYSFLSTEPKGKYIIRLCNNLSCIVNGSDNVRNFIEKLLGIRLGETTKDKRFSLEMTSCIGCCNNPPAMMINNKVFTNLTEERISEIIKNLR